MFEFDFDFEFQFQESWIFDFGQPHMNRESCHQTVSHAVSYLCMYLSEVGGLRGLHPMSPCMDLNDYSSCLQAAYHPRRKKGDALVVSMTIFVSVSVSISISIRRTLNCVMCHVHAPYNLFLPVLRWTEEDR